MRRWRRPATTPRWPSWWDSSATCRSAACSIRVGAKVPPPKLGIVAGGGDLPRRLVAACRAQGRAVFVVALEGQCNAEDFAAVPHDRVRLGAFGRAIRLLHEAGVVEVVLAGRVRRPALAELRP